MRDRSKALAIARAAALFFAVAAVTALVLWTQTREVRRPARVVQPAAMTAPTPAPPVAPDPTPAPAPAPAAALAPTPTPTPAPTPDDRRVYFSTSKAMMAPRLDPPPAPAARAVAPPPPSQVPNGAER